MKNSINNRKMLQYFARKQAILFFMLNNVTKSTKINCVFIKK